MSQPSLFRVCRRRFLLWGLCVVGSCLALGRADAVESSARWYKGNTHAHSFWSDGNEFPEMVADWYKSHGYDFLAISDHNNIEQGEKWKPMDSGKRPLTTAVIEKCRRRFGGDWLEIRSEGKHREVKLKTFEEVGAKLSEPGRFLLIRGEEITDKCGDRQVHMNAVNLAELAPPQHGDTVADTIRRNFEAVARQARRLQRPILVHLNHPEWVRYDITPEDLASNAIVGFFEVRNAGPWRYFYGDAVHPGVEKLWDIANTIRLVKMKAAPLYGVASDDAHSYHKFAPEEANPGRGWIVVRADKLSADALLEAISRGDFYASTGVVLRDVAFDATTKTLRVAVRSEPGVRYTIEFVGTPNGVDPTATPAPDVPEPFTKVEKRDVSKLKRPGGRYAAEIGQVFKSVEGEAAEYQMTGRELYVRAVIHSDKPMANPPLYGTGNAVNQQAWCQPVGWKN
jgi:hypothetical protein